VDLATFGIKISRSENLPVLPQVVSSVLKLADDPYASPRMMERLVERDPALTAKVLRVANSAAYASGQVSSLGRALSVLGMSTVKSLVVGVAFQQIISGKQATQYFDKLEFWRHCLATATIARILGKLKLPMKAEELYCAGMLHDVGLLILEKFSPHELDQVVRMAKLQHLPRIVAEEQSLGFTHCDLGKLLVEKWGLCGIIGNAVMYHHDPASDGEHYDTTCFIAAADTIAYQCGFGNHSSQSDSLDPAVLAAIGIDEGQLPAIRAAIATEIERAIMAFNIK
jgi:HD-like signal output (HDOD) protein